MSADREPSFVTSQPFEIEVSSKSVYVFFPACFPWHQPNFPRHSQNVRQKCFLRLPIAFFVQNSWQCRAVCFTQHTQLWGNVWPNPFRPVLPVQAWSNEVIPLLKQFSSDRFPPRLVTNPSTDQALLTNSTCRHPVASLDPTPFLGNQQAQLKDREFLVEVLCDEMHLWCKVCQGSTLRATPGQVLLHNPLHHLMQYPQPLFNVTWTHCPQRRLPLP